MCVTALCLAAVTVLGARRGLTKEQGRFADRRAGDGVDAIGALEASLRGVDDLRAGASTLRALDTDGTKGQLLSRLTLPEGSPTSTRVGPTRVGPRGPWTAQQCAAGSPQAWHVGEPAW